MYTSILLLGSVFCHNTNNKNQLGEKAMDLKADQPLEVVEALLDATSAGPNPGLSSRDLILRAARKACFQEGNDLPDQSGQSSSEELVAPSPTHTPADAKDSQIPAPVSGMLADMLVQEGLTVHERPTVQYTPRSSVPRIARQVRLGWLDAQPCMLISCAATMTREYS